MKLVKATPQTLRTLCTFEDGSEGWDSRRWDALVGASIPTNAHTLTPKQTEAVVFAALHPDRVKVKRPKLHPAG